MTWDVRDPCLAPSRVSQRSQHNQHAVQFYERDEFLAEVVARFIAAGLAAGDRVILFATQAHIRGVRQHFQRHEWEVAAASRRLRVYDAEASLATIMASGHPDPACIQALLREMLEPGEPEFADGLLDARGLGPVRVYGEMVDLLLRDGNLAAAHQLEELWSDLGRRQPLSLLCSYALSGFAEDVEAAHFASICAQHSHVMPTECYLRLEDERARLREVSRLQQRDRALRRASFGVAVPANAQQLPRADTQTVLAQLLLRALSRELREPLQAMLDATRALARSSAGAHVQRMLRRGSRMLRVLEDVADLTRARLGAGMPVLREDEHDAAAIVARVVAARRARHPERAIELSVSFTRPVCIDAARYEQVATILIDHALARAEPERTIGVSVEAAADGFGLNVRFRGDALALMPLDPLMRTARELSDTAWDELGLPLHIAERIVHAHGGQLTVRSSRAGGTTFEALFPA
jgi:signal transduction histidine kinase